VKEQQMQTILYYVHDPMCSWCWGFRPTWRKIVESLPSGMVWERVLGGLAPDTDQPMPEEMRQYLQKTWGTIQSRLGTEFNFDFWTRCEPRRATYPACRAVIAAREQDAEEAMIDAIQQAYYLRAMNPSEDETLITLARELELDAARFEADLNSPSTRDELARQVAFSRGLGAQGFPGLILESGPGRWPVEYDYRDPAVTLAQLERLVGDAAASG